MLKYMLAVVLSISYTSLIAQDYLSQILPIDATQQSGYAIHKRGEAYHILYRQSTSDGAAFGMHQVDGVHSLTSILGSESLALRPIVQQHESVYIYGFEDHDILLSKMNDDLTTIDWSRDLDDHTGFTIKSDATTLLGYIYLSATSNLDLPADAFPYLSLYRMSKNGGKRWYRTYLHDVSRDIFSTSIEATADSALLIGFTFIDQEANRLSVMKLDTNGLVEWQYVDTLNRASLTNYATPLADGSLVSVGQVGVYFSPAWVGLSRQPLVLRWLTTDGQSTAMKYLTQPENYQLTPSGIKELPDSSLMLYGRYGKGCSPTCTESYAHLLKMSSSGDTLWVRNYTHPDYTASDVNYIIQDILLEEGGYTTLLINIKPTTGDQRIWLLTVDEQGCPNSAQDCSDYITTSLLEDTHSSAAIYPNPSTGVVVFGESLLDIVVTDLVGRRCMTFAGSRQSIDLSTLPSGVYYITGNTAEGATVTEKLILSR